MKINIANPEHLESVRAFAGANGCLPEFEIMFRRMLSTMQREENWPPMPGWHLEAVVMPDFAAHSFAWGVWEQSDTSRDTRRRYNGGLIYSGPTQHSDGGFPSLVVSLNQDASQGRRHMWSIHT